MTQCNYYPPDWGPRAGIMLLFFRSLLPYRWQKKYCNKMDEARHRYVEIWEIGNPKNEKTKIKIKICVAQNVGKIQISRRNTSQPPFGAISGKVSMDWKNVQNCSYFCYFPWWSNGCYSTFNRFGAMVAIFLLPPVCFLLNVARMVVSTCSYHNCTICLMPRS